MTPRDLQNAFPPMPEMCRDALMTAGSSCIEEEKKMKRSLRFTVVLAALLLALTSAAYAVSRPQILDWLLKRDATVPLWLEEAAQNVGVRASSDGVNVSIDSLVYDGDWLMVSFEMSVDDPTQAVMIAMDDQILLNGEPFFLYGMVEPNMLPRPGLFDPPVQRSLYQWGAEGTDISGLSGTVEAELTFRVYHPEKGFVMVDENGVLTGDDPDAFRWASSAMLQDCRDAVTAMTNVAVIGDDPEPWIAEGYTPVDRHGQLIAKRDEAGQLIVDRDELHLTETTLTVRFTFDADTCTVYDFSGVEVPRLRDAWVHVKTFRLSPLSCRVDVYLIPYINDTHVNNEHDSYLMYQEYGKAVLTDENGNELTYTDIFWSSGGMHCFMDMEGDEWCVRYSVTLPGLETLPGSIGLTTREGDIVRFNLP